MIALHIQREQRLFTEEVNIWHIYSNNKAANFLFLSDVDTQKKTKARGKWHTLPDMNVGLNSFQSSAGMKVSSSGDHQMQFLSQLSRGSSSRLSLSLRQMQCPPVRQSLSCERCCSESGKRRRCGIKFWGQLFGRFRAEHKTTSDRNKMSRQDGVCDNPSRMAPLEGNLWIQELWCKAILALQNFNSTTAPWNKC